MHQNDHREVEHTIEIEAAAAEVYALIADVRQWPRIFPPTVHAEQAERFAGAERIQIWATANGTAKTWTSRRTLDAAALRIDFRQEVSAPPVAAMGGAWLIEPAGERRSLVRLLHDYRAIGDEPAALEWIDQAVDRNSRAELAALKANVEAASGTGGQGPLSFTDSVHVAGSAKDVYDFLNEAQLWSERLPHVARVHLREEAPGLQLLEMDTLTKDGSQHTTASYRVCLPHHRIVYKQVGLPALMSLHTGHWVCADDGDRLRVTSRHTVRINPDSVGRVLGAGADVPQARDFIRHALGANSRATLEHAKEYAESRR